MRPTPRPPPLDRAAFTGFKTADRLCSDSLHHDGREIGSSFGQRANGQRVGTVPYGYHLAFDGRSLVVDRYEATIITRIRAIRAGGMSLERIARRLTAERVPTKTGRSSR